MFLHIFNNIVRKLFNNFSFLFVKTLSTFNYICPTVLNVYRPFVIIKLSHKAYILFQ